jgi:hypothetical protein
VPVADLITHRLPLERAVEGIHTVIRGEAIKVTVEPAGDSAGRTDRRCRSESIDRRPQADTEGPTPG